MEIKIGDQAGSGYEPRLEVIEVFEHTLAYRYVGDKYRVFMTTKVAWLDQLKKDQEFRRHTKLIQDKFNKA